MEGFVYYGNLDGVHFLVSLERENDEFLKSYQTSSPTAGITPEARCLRVRMLTDNFR